MQSDVYLYSYTAVDRPGTDGGSSEAMRCPILVLRFRDNWISQRQSPELVGDFGVPGNEQPKSGKGDAVCAEDTPRRHQRALPRP